MRGYGDTLSAQEAFACGPVSEALGRHGIESEQVVRDVVLAIARDWPAVEGLASEWGAEMHQDCGTDW